MIKVILWDIDGTLLDFEAAETAAMRQCFASHQLGECTDEMLKRYSVINQRYWKALEKGEMTKPEILVGRFREFFTAEGLNAEVAESFNAEYQIRLGDTIVFRDNAYELVQKFKGTYLQYAVTNGTKVAQDRKLKNSKLDTLLDGVFISDVLGVEKPNIEFFNKVFEVIGTYESSEVIIVGDSLTSDMRGGNNAGIVTCWYHPQKSEHSNVVPDVKIDFEISNLWELEAILN